MGFLAFLLIGGVSGTCTWIFYPKRSQGSDTRGILIATALGFIAEAGSSFLGQYTGFFQSGQMLEWASAILASCALGCVYTALAK